MMGPTGGYLLGFVVAAFISGLLATKGFTRTFLGALAVALVANVAVYAFGLTWLASLIGTEKAITFGLMPFLYSDALKMLLAASLMTAGSRLAR
jgi:biotin transport system substrate-specific component